MNINKVTLAGRLTRDPEKTEAKSGIAISKIRLAINKKRKATSGDYEEQATFMDVTFFDRTAETINQYLRKGEALYIEGRLEVSEWEDKETGKPRSKLEVIGNSFQFMPKPRQDDASANQPKPAANAKEEELDEIPF